MASRQDIYIVADKEGQELVLKLHRFVLLRASPGCQSDRMNAWQPRSHILPCDQIETRLHGQAKIGIVDVHVPPRCREGIRLHEGRLSRRFVLLMAKCVCHQVLYEHDFPVPRPVDQARHCILMEFIDAYPL